MKMKKKYPRRVLVPRVAQASPFLPALFGIVFRVRVGPVRRLLAEISNAQTFGALVPWAATAD
jgi:hypothetical protein